MSICQGEKRTYTVTGANSYTWHSGANTSTIVLNPTVTASYSVSGTGTNACPGFKQFTVTVSKCTDIETLAGNEESFSIYPNPSNGKLFVETAAAVKIKILDKAGVVQLDVFFEAGKHDLDISHLSSGIYVVHSTTKNGTSISRLVKID